MTMQLTLLNYSRVPFYAVILQLALGNCIDFDLGMESGAILDSQLTASSELNPSTPAKNGRLNAVWSSWCASTNDSNPYLQIDLETLHIICAVSTQGNFQGDQWVESYTLQASTDGTIWTYYKNGGQVEIFTGNSDRNTENKNIISDGLLTRWLRLIAYNRHNGFCLRTEVFGVKQKPDNLAAGKPTIQSSTCCNGTSVNAVDGNINPYHDSQGFCSQTNEDNPSWWRVDLGLNHVPVYEVPIVNRFSDSVKVREGNEDYKITLGNNATVSNNPECEGRYSFIQFIASAVCYSNPLKTGRFVGIMTTKKQSLQLCEVEIYSRENLAFGKPTDQTSTTWGGVSSRAVDGNSNTIFDVGYTCTHTLDEKNPWWRVDLSRVEPVNEVYIVSRGDCCEHSLSLFEIRVGSIPDSGGITNPKCGSNYNVFRGQGASFFCRPSLYGTYLTIRITKVFVEALMLCEVEVYSERRACQIQSLGLASSYTFSSNSFSASSSSAGNEASKGRLYGSGTWSPSTDVNPNDYLQIDLQHEFFICAVATQGNPNADHWTTKYKLLLSVNNTDWVTYRENNTDKVFNANNGRSDIVKHNLVGVHRAKFIRFQPTNFTTRKALRVEVYGLIMPSAPSQAPTSFSVTPLNSTSIKASWQLPTIDSVSGIITGFKLLYRNKISAADPLTVITIGSKTTLTRDITGLEKFTEYEFQILAILPMGNGAQSAVKTVRTTEDAPSQAPTNLTATAGSSTSILVSWQLPPPYSRNGIITGFQLFYNRKYPAPCPQTTNTVTISGGTTLTENITGLLKYTEYEFRVLAFTSIGGGPNSSVVVEKTGKDVPSQAPTNFSVTAASSTSVTATWMLPPADSRNGIITRFKLFYQKIVPVGSPTSVLPIHDGEILTRTVTGLEKLTEYRFQVLAFTSVGDGPRSPIKEAKTKEGDAPAIIRLSETTIVTVGELAILTCQVSGNPNPSVTWTKDGHAIIPRAHFQNNGRLLAIQGVILGDEGVYQCKASNLFGESQTATSLVVGAPPNIADDVSPASVICEKQSLCSLNCFATSPFPVTYSWSKGGEIPDSDEVKVMNNTLVVRPRHSEHYGEYVCNATNKFGSTTYKVTLSEYPKCLTATQRTTAVNDPNSVFRAAVIGLSCVVSLLLIIVLLLLCRLRRTFTEKESIPNREVTTAGGGQHDTSCVQNDPGSYMELHPRLSETQTYAHAPSEYASLHGRTASPGYYNVGFSGRKEEQYEEVYDEIGNDQTYEIAIGKTMK